MNAWFADALRRRVWLAGVCAASLAMFLPGNAAADVVDLRQEIAELNRMIDNWQERHAEPRLRALLEEHPEEPALRWLDAKLLFHLHDYDASAAAIERLVAEGPPLWLQRPLQDLEELVRNTIEATRDHEIHVTRNGLFEISHDPRRDALLIPWAEETLEAAWYEIGYDLGHWPEPPIRVEFFSRASVLGRVSSLSEEAVRTTSTIALCKYNKLMMTSPRGTLRGYGWRTTLAHEYVHYVVGQLTADRVPVWLHEAIAKLLEERWTGERRFRLDPSQESLLARRLEEGNLLTFDQMHPSMAYLPSQEDAATGYAQVFTVALFMMEREGPGVLRRLMRSINAHDDVRDAIAEVMGSPFDRFLDDWNEWLRDQELTRLPEDFLDEIELREGASDDPGDEDRRFQGVEEPRARDHLRLGEMLRARGMTEAARQSYERAESLLGRHHPELQNALARTLLDLSEPEAALEALQEVAVWYPGFHRTHLHRGEALNRMGRFDEALVALERAAGINPFDPAVHRERGTALDALGRDEEASRAREIARQLR
ncbi:MAG: hypothetical protein EA398_11380 [Deltaproteobacteria bacterium]|nr:MAG: hypothetical protein EA398_11380 [Deltaproteobacteria bacterium]